LNDCYPCRLEASGSPLPPREQVYDDGLWRVAHAFNSTLPGWLVALPRRHITSLAELTSEEAVALGPLLRRLTAALAEVTGCQKTYVALFAEADGFDHLHLHVVPRVRDLPDDRRGPQVFGYLARDESEWLPEPERDRLARAVSAVLLRAGGPAL
jgi:diadenosine tetraphosphate (Ap4A) HIT family hydrolase